MKKIIFLVLILNSFLFAYTCQNDFKSSTSLITLSSTASLNYIGTEPMNTFYCPDSTSTQVLKNRSCSLVSGNYKCYKDYYNFSPNYTGCPSGQEIINGVCATPPTCASDTAWDSLTDTCKPIPPPDADSDGTPDKCDFDFANYATLDCDDDTKLNGTDDDIDDDGILNASDTDDNKDGTADYLQPSSPDYDLSCRGVNSTTATNLPYPFREYSFYSDIDSTRCSFLVLDNSKIDATVSLVDINHPRCEKPYCYVHYAVDKCNFDASWYSPGIGWDYLAGKTESQCSLLVDGVKYSTSSYMAPDTLKCPTTGFCYLKRVDTTPLPDDKNSEDGDESMKAPDLNSTTADLAPLLNAQNTTNKHLDDLKLKADISNNHLDDLKRTADDSLNIQRDAKSVLSDLKSNSDKSLSNDLDGITKLAGISSSLDGLSKTTANMSDTVTANQGVINNNLTDMGFSLDTIKGLLSDGLMGDNPFPDAPDDGSSTFGEKQTILTDNLSITYKPNFLGFSSISGSISPITFSILGRTFTLLGADTINQIPVDSIRGLFLFIAAVTGFITIFMTV